MKTFRTLKVISGFLLIINSITIFVMLFLEPETMGVFFRFNIDIQAENLGEAIAGFALGIGAIVGMIIMTLVIGAGYLVIYLIIGIVTAVVKKGKGLIIVVIILTCLSLFLEGRALTILLIGEKSSIILPVRITMDAIILGISIYCLVVLSKNPNVIESNISQ